MTAVERIAAIRAIVAAARDRGERVGLVPTMGALHAGHLSLMQAARNECDFVVATIFVNPKQFGPQEDFRKYPRDLATDLRLCAEAGVDAVFHPPTEEVYPPGFTSFVEMGGLSEVLEGRFRPGHFRGVATVVLKLFQMVPADCAYFGQKDYQQQAIIRRMCGDLNVPIEIRVCPTIREPDGLALSSRNVFLNEAERKAALSLSRALHLARQKISEGATDLHVVRDEMRQLLNSTPTVHADYATLVDPDTLEEIATVLPRQVAVVAARVGVTRLIDNLIIEK
ncbi:MAG: pantoate--beta-alanine ligase [Planctomycetaceae bacterium]|nr:pantoate--beta-alanine ligase [Planctomycetaceae bacterium]